ncbi:MAG: hypothetical protein IT307_13940 [Chloroflexi bacterium]|nr:hypothetical protein [Chloroflexota bacterium]
MAETTSYELILSVNGKHVVIAQWSDLRLSDTTLEFVRRGFKDVVIERAATDPEKQDDGQSNAPYCGDHQIPMVLRPSRFKKGQTYWACPYKDADGTYCKYRPAKS